MGTYVTLLKVYGTLLRDCQTFVGISQFLGYVKLLWGCHTFVGMSHFRGNVKISQVCQTFVGMSHVPTFISFRVSALGIPIIGIPRENGILLFPFPREKF